MNIPMPPLYRAQPFTEALARGHAQVQRDTVRLPSNVPYAVDNLWEFLRPPEMPSRRRAVYASPTRTLARANCSGSDKGQGFCVFEMVIDGAVKLAQLPVRDAREHADLRMLAKLVQERADDWMDLRDDERAFVALLFMPGAAAREIGRAKDTSPFAAAFLAEAARRSTFWQDASTQHVDAEGELFIELMDGQFRARSLERYA